MYVLVQRSAIILILALSTGGGSDSPVDARRDGATGFPSGVLRSVVVAGVPSGPAHEALASAPARRFAPHASTAQETGGIAGEVRIERTPARRTAERYAGAVPAPERAVQDVPAVVYLKGGSGPAGAASVRPRLVQKDTMFVPGALVVPLGTTVEFPNGDPFFHNVFSYSRPKRFDLGRYPQAESKSVHFDAPGIVKVYCEVHRSMRALVVVVESPYHAVVDEDGRFEIEGVPPGRYELVVVDADRGTRTLDVAVTAGRTSEVTVSLE